MFLKNKIIIYSAAVLLILSGVSHAQVISDKQARIEAATQYEKTVPVEDMVNDMLDEIKGNPQIDLTDTDVEAIRDSYDFEALRGKLIETMAEHFTVEEIQALNEFYSKPEGQSVMKKMPGYMNDFMPHVQEQTIVGVRKVMEERAKVQEEQEKQESSE